MAEPFEASQLQREWLAFLDPNAFFTVEVCRSDIAARFGIKLAVSSRDLTLYREVAPANLECDAVARGYRPAIGFAPIFGFNPERVLGWLLQGFGDGLDTELKPAAPCEGPGQLSQPHLGTLGAITRGMRTCHAIHINCHSLSSGGKRREIVAVAFADNGLRWHVRAFDRETFRFRDLVLTRISTVEEPKIELAPSESLTGDEKRLVSSRCNWFCTRVSSIPRRLSLTIPCVTGCFASTGGQRWLAMG